MERLGGYTPFTRVVLDWPISGYIRSFGQSFNQYFRVVISQVPQTMATQMTQASSAVTP